MDAASVDSFVHSQQQAFNAISIVMLTDYLFPKSTELKDGDEFDFIIVGGGTAGCVVANRLVKANFRVLLLEAGHNTPLEAFLPATLGILPQSRIDWNYTAEPNNFSGKCHPSSRVPLTAGKVLGGSSTVTFLITTRGHYTDYQRWAVAANDSSWEYEHLIHLFTKNERLQSPKIANSAYEKYHGIGGSPPDYPNDGEGKIETTVDKDPRLCNYLRSYKEMGNNLFLDLNGYNIGYVRGLLSLAEGYRQCTSYCYLTPAYIQDSKSNPLLFVSTNTLVTKIVFDENKNAVGVMAEINNKKPIYLKAKNEVILTAGAINSPQLLMLSGIGKRKHLEVKNITVIADLPVGENFQDNTVVHIVHKTKKTKFPTSVNFHEYTAGVIFGMKSLNTSSKHPDYGTITYLVNTPDYISLFCGYSFKILPEICDRLKKQDIDREISYTLLFDLHPKSRGKVLLKSVNPRDAPIIDAGYYTNKKDIENTVKYIKDFVPIENTTFFSNSGGSIVYPTGKKCCQEVGTDDYWKCYAYCMSGTLWNYCGTCSMGSVVDSQLKVYGVNKLRVADASIMPNPISGGNFMATIVVAEKASNMIKEKWKK